MIDVSDPSQPTLLATGDGTAGRDVEVRGDVAWVSAFEVLDAFDVSDPAAPLRFQRFFQGGDRHVELSRGRVYAVGAPGLRVYQDEAPLPPLELGGLRVAAAGLAVAPGLVVYLAPSSTWGPLSPSGS